MSLKLTIKTLERHQQSRSGAIIDNFEQVLYSVLVFSLLTLNKKVPAGYHATWIKSI